MYKSLRLSPKPQLQPQPQPRALGGWKKKTYIPKYDLYSLKLACTCTCVAFQFRITLAPKEKKRKKREEEEALPSQVKMTKQSRSLLSRPSQRTLFHAWVSTRALI